MNNKVTIANNYHQYLHGDESGLHCDGIIFSHVTDEDTEIIKELAQKYNKEVHVHENHYDYELEETFVAPPKVAEVKAVKPTDGRSIAKIYVNNGTETIKILPDQLEEYQAKGYSPGRHKKVVTP